MSTPILQAPQSFIVRQECEKAAWQHGFRRPMAAASEGWAAFASTTVPGTLSLAAAGDHGPWFLALDHGGVVKAIGFAPTAMPGPGLARYSFPDLGTLYGVLPRIYALSASLPDAPLQQFCGPGSQPAPHHRGRAVGGSAHRPGYFSRQPHGVLAGLLPPHRHQRSRSAAGFPHHSLEAEPILLTPNHQTHLAWHRQHGFGKGRQDGPRDH